MPFPLALKNEKALKTQLMQFSLISDARHGPSAPMKDPWDNQRIGASATTKMNRKDFAVNGAPGIVWRRHHPHHRCRTDPAARQVALTFGRVEYTAFALERIPSTGKESAVERSMRFRCLVLSAAATLGLLGCGGGNGMAGPQPGFALSSETANAVVGQGGSTTSTITLRAPSGFTGSVSLSASGLPSGISALFNPPVATTTSVMTMTVNAGADTGTTSLAIKGASGVLSATTLFNLTVALPSVRVTLSPKHAELAATSQPQQFTATAIGNMGSTAVVWSVDGMATGNPAVGTVSAGGLYTPAAAGGSHTVTATSLALSSASASASVAVTDLPGVLAYHNNLSRDGSNLQEYALTGSAVNTSTFGKLFSCAVDGALYAQPLWMPGLSIGGGIHNVVFVATEHDSLYAFDADASPCVNYWHANLLDPLHGGTANETPIIWNDVGHCGGDIYPEIGVTGTPVIDATTHTVYLVSSSEAGTAGANCSFTPGTFYRRLHALDLTTGNEKFNGPVGISASLPGIGDGGSTVDFEPQKHHQRSGLALAGGRVYVPWSAHEDATPCHGWLMGFSASDLSQSPSIFNTTPNGGLGGIWAAGAAPAVDSMGDIYVSTGNGIFDANSTTVPFNDYGDSLLRLRPLAGNTLNGVNLSLVDWFTPFDQLNLGNTDVDLGSGGIVLLPDQSSGPAHLLVQVGKEGVVYLIDRDNMGFFNSTDNSQIVQSFYGPPYGAWGTPALWQNNLYIGGQDDPIRQFAFDPSTGLFNTTPVSQSTQVFHFPGTTPSVSSHGTSDGIVWVLDASLYGYATRNATGGIVCSVAPPPPACTGPAILHAYKATDLATEYWNSAQAAGNRDRAGSAVKFVPPTVANGKVYVGTRTEIDVYGLLSK